MHEGRGDEPTKAAVGTGDRPSPEPAIDADSNAPSGGGPEPSLASRMDIADLEDAFETGAPPFDADTRPTTDDETTSLGERMRGEGSAVTPPSAVNAGGRVNAARATLGARGASAQRRRGTPR